MKMVRKEKTDLHDLPFTATDGWLLHATFEFE